MRDINLCDKTPLAAVSRQRSTPSQIIGNTVRQLCVSTDYVFDSNEEDRPLNEDAVSRGALSVYGQTKLNGEKEGP
jgi:dTDP-4-dehydrorhamnose reductase